MSSAPEIGSGSRVYDVAVEEESSRKRVYLGGKTVGFSLDINGVLVTNVDYVDTPVGKSTLKNQIYVGDIIKEVNSVAVDSAEDVTTQINLCNNCSCNILIERGEKSIELTISPLIDRISGEKRLGISIQTEICGLGTVTYTKQDGSFGALGHAVGIDGGCAEVSGGEVYNCKLLGIQKGARGEAGAIKGSLDKKSKIGCVYENRRCGIFGEIEENGILYNVASKAEVTCGRAMICSEVSGKREFYDIEIIKSNNLSSDEEKGLVIKIRDKRLLALTGGIVQGMSGSPIIQNDKIVGAVTHVFINDPTRGYGIFIDNMLNRLPA